MKQTRNRPWQVILSLVIILLPALAGLILWNRLPNALIPQWQSPDSPAFKALVIVGIPVLMAAIQLVCLHFTARDPGNREQNPLVLSLVTWIVPVVALLAFGNIYRIALGHGPASQAWTTGFLGAMALVFGNYFPKIQQNATIGIRTGWAMGNKTNWFMTHRFAGVLWTVGGLIILVMTVSGFRYNVPCSIAVMLVLAFGPVIYSWAFARKQKKAGTWKSTLPPTSKAQIIAGVIAGVLVLGAVMLVLGMGHLDVTFTDGGFTVSATMYGDLLVPYEQIDSAEYRESCDLGYRAVGFSNLKLSIGTYENEEFGAFTRYTYAGDRPCIVLRHGDDVLVIGAKTAEETRTIFDTIQSNLQAG